MTSKRPARPKPSAAPTEPVFGVGLGVSEWRRTRAAKDIAEVLKTVAQLRRDGMPPEIGSKLDAFLYWIRAAKALPILRRFERDLSALDYTADDLRRMVREHISSCEEILGPAWVAGRYRNVERDPRFGAFVFDIYSAILPGMASLPQRRRLQERRPGPVVFNIAAARLTARAINFACARALGRRLSDRDVLSRVRGRTVVT